MEDAISDFINKLRLEKFTSEQQKAEESLLLLESIVADGKWDTARDLIVQLRNFDNVVQNIMPWETTPCNMLLRVIKLVFDDYNACRLKTETTEGSSLSQLMFTDPVTDNLPHSIVLPALKNIILESLSEYKAEVEQSTELIANQGESKIHSDEVVMTCGCCPMVLAFLTKAGKKRKFHVIVAECAPKYDGHSMAKSLSSAGIQTTLIQDCAIFALMSRVNKVFIGTQTVLRNGGIKTFVGAAPLALAAKFYSVPLYVCTPTYKFSIGAHEETNYHDCPSVIVPASIKLPDTVNLAVTKLDYVPPENVTSFITNIRGISPSYVYRQLSELYHPASYDI